MDQNTERDYEFEESLRNLKNMLSDYVDITTVIPDDLVGTKTYSPEYYSENIKLYRSHETSLVYIYDEADDTDGLVELEDLRVILYNIAHRLTKQKRQAYELEKFLSE